MELIDLNKVISDTATNVLSGIFSSSREVCVKAWNWSKAEIAAKDPFGYAAKTYSDKFLERHNLLKVMGMNEPVALTNIYVRVNILKEIESRHKRNRTFIEEMEREFAERIDNFGYPIREGIGALEMANDLQFVTVLGKPGGGKSTLLKYIGIQALKGNLNNKRIPILITLKDYADSNMSLDEFILREFEICNLPEAKPIIQHHLTKGDLLFLLDGLDEVGKENINKICKTIINYSDKYSKNQFIISCRTAAYNQNLTRFKDVELAKFNNEQIRNFILNWFGSNKMKSKQCIDKVFLSKNKPIQELSTNPLLLTLLCLAFDDAMDFPSNRYELYRDATDALLKKWYSFKNVPHDEIYHGLSVTRKAQMLSNIAAENFEKQRYFMRTELLENQILKYLENIQNSSDPIDSNEILKTIEAQHGLLIERTHGIYSFSHLTIQEYFTANYVVDNSERGFLKKLVKYITDRRWREVFLLSAEKLYEADDFLLMMKKEADSLIKDDNMKKLLIWVHEKSCSVKSKYNNNVVKGYYLWLHDQCVKNYDREAHRNIINTIGRGVECYPISHSDTNSAMLYFSCLSRDFAKDFFETMDKTYLFCDDFYDLGDHREPESSLQLPFEEGGLEPNSLSVYSQGLLKDLHGGIPLEMTLDLYLYFAYNFSLNNDQSNGLYQILKIGSMIASQLGLTSLSDSLSELKVTSPYSEAFVEEWLNWRNDFQIVLVTERNICHNIAYDRNLTGTLNDYLYANMLIIECLESQCYVSMDVREAILSSILLPSNS